MDLQWQIAIVDQMIRETPDATIRDFLELIDELKTIEKGNDQYELFDKTIIRHMKCLEEKYQ